jgi:phosphoribosylformimino-5-aminoimidazole carboxamide ribotide isomerase
MIVIPAVDIRKGCCVRLVQGDLSRQTVYSDDPVETACRWAEEGAGRLHVVDLDGAFGESSNLDLILKIQESCGIPVELGGGLRDEAAVRAALAGGIARVILGTALMAGAPWVEKVSAEFPGRVMAGLDTKDGQVMVKGWTAASGLPLTDAVKRVESLGIREIIFTDINTDGNLQGPNLKAIEGLLRLTKVAVIASGGVSSVEDVRRLASLRAGDRRVAGCVVGKALYDNQLTLAEALEAADSPLPTGGIS